MAIAYTATRLSNKFGVLTLKYFHETSDCKLIWNGNNGNTAEADIADALDTDQLTNGSYVLTLEPAQTQWAISQYEKLNKQVRHDHQKQNNFWWKTLYILV